MSDMMLEILTARLAAEGSAEAGGADRGSEVGDNFDFDRDLDVDSSNDEHAAVSVGRREFIDLMMMNLTLGSAP